MNINSQILVTARHLRTGDLLVGSGFVVTHGAYTSVRCPKGKVHVEGRYPGKRAKVATWNANTTLMVVREN